jgi:capsular polysaccharide biosynthesis protein
VTVEVGGSESFQHFVQDCLPLITFIKQKTDLFDSNTILIKELKPSSESILLILELLFPELDFIYLNKSTVFSINCLKVISFHPKNYVFSLPREVVSSLNREVEKMNLTMDISNSLIFLDRGRQKSRNIENIDDLFRALKTFLNQKGFDFVVIDTSSAPLKGSIPTIRTAKIILGVHGGSMYNAIFAHKDAVIMELLPTINTDSVANLFVDLGFRYAPIFLDYDKSDKSFQVPIDLVLLELESILKGLHV